MAENQQQNQNNSQSSIKLYYRRSMTRRQNTDRNYITLYSGRYLINKNIENIYQMINRNFRKFGK